MGLGVVGVGGSDKGIKMGADGEFVNDVQGWDGTLR